jgi:hypothetical protein
MEVIKTKASSLRGHTNTHPLFAGASGIEGLEGASCA